MKNYTVTTTAQTLDTIMGDDFDGSKSYIIHVNNNAPSVLSIIPTGEDGRGYEIQSFADYDIGKDGASYDLKSSFTNIDICIIEKSE